MKFGMDVKINEHMHINVINAYLNKKKCSEVHNIYIFEKKFYFLIIFIY
jgi:hypothetical protein